MRKSILLITTIGLLGTGHSATPVGAIERGTPVRITPNHSTFYNTTGITTGNYLWVYHQGGDGDEGTGDPNCFGTAGDRIIAYRARINNGVPGTFERVGRISPVAKSPTKTSGFWPPSCVRPPASYGPGQVFRGRPPAPPGVPSPAMASAKIGIETRGISPVDPNGYHLIADVSDTFVFKTWWRATSSDGLNWTWYVSGSGNTSGTETLTRSDTGTTYTIRRIKVSTPFLKATSNLQLFNPIFLADNDTWWGFFNFFHAGRLKIGATKVDWSTGSPSIKIASSLSPSWSYTTLSNATLNFIPATAAIGNAKTLIQQGSGFRLWAWVNDVGRYGQNVSCDTSRWLQCGQPGGCKTGDGTTLAQGAWGRPFWLNTGPRGDVACSSCKGSGFAWWNVTSSTIGGRNLLSSRVRALPSGYEHARMFPFRWNSPTGKRYLFSATNDANICSEFLFSSFFKVYVVRTEV